MARSRLSSRCSLRLFSSFIAELATMHLEEMAGSGQRLADFGVVAWVMPVAKASVGRRWDQAAFWRALWYSRCKSCCVTST